MDKITNFFNAWNQQLIELDNKNAECPETEDFITTPEDLEKYCSCVKAIIDKSNEILNTAYGDENYKKLTEILNRNVVELLIVEKEIRNHCGNINALRNQIRAVQSNLQDQRRKLKTVKNEERKIRISLASDARTERNNNLSLIPRPKRFSFCPIGNSIGSEQEEITTNTRNSRIAKRNFVGPVQKTKLTRQQRRNELEKQKPGITLFLKPIQELQNYNSNTNTSVVQFMPSNSASLTTSATIPESSRITNTNSLVEINSSSLDSAD